MGWIIINLGCGFRARAGVLAATVGQGRLARLASRSSFCQKPLALRRVRPRVTKPEVEAHRFVNRECLSQPEIQSRALRGFRSKHGQGFSSLPEVGEILKCSANLTLY